jgi:hypothetical protein
MKPGDRGARTLPLLFTSAGLFSLWFSLLIFGQPLGGATHLLLLLSVMLFWWLGRRES